MEIEKIVYSNLLDNSLFLQELSITIEPNYERLWKLAERANKTIYSLQRKDFLKEKVIEYILLFDKDPDLIDNTAFLKEKLLTKYNLEKIYEWKSD